MGKHHMNNRTISATLGRRVIWAGLTLSLLGLAGVQVSPPRPPEQRRIPAAFAMAYLLDCGCLDPSATQAEIDAYMQQAGYHPEGPTPPAPVGESPGDEPIFGEPRVWTYYPNPAMERTTVPLASAKGAGATVRYSFAGTALTDWIDVCFPGNRDQGLEYIRQGMAAWSRNSGLLLAEVADPGDPFSEDLPAQSDETDIRIFGEATTASGQLGQAWFPRTGGDLWLNVSDYAPLRNGLRAKDRLFGAAGSPNDYRLLRNATGHEFGHSIGLYHVRPTLKSHLMESPVPNDFEGLSNHEMRMVQRMYGDRLTTRDPNDLTVRPNWTSADAADLGDITSRSVFEANLSTNGYESIAGEDWFSFTLSSDRYVVIIVNPTGGSYWLGPDSDPGSMGVRRGERAANLAFTLVGPNPENVYHENRGSLDQSPYGASETYSATLAAGSYKLRVYDAGPANDPTNMVVQLYDLSIRVGNSLVPPRAVAGIHKRVLINTTCHFMGQFHSRALEPGARIVAYEWDFDNDFIADSTQPHATHIFTTPGTKSVRLRVQDSFQANQTEGAKWSDWDEIKVDVFE